MKKILFVDDEPQILEGLRHRLHRRRQLWDMRFAISGEEALEMLALETFDIIVSDMRMPGMDGATLLRRVQELHPDVVRIVLSGFAEFETALRVVPVAHQFLSKPCDANVLESVVTRACDLQALLKEEALRRLAGSIDRLPALPRVYAALVSAVAKEDASAEEIAAILKQDTALCAKALQIVNSAFFGLGRPISRVEEAVVYLGYSRIKQIVLAVEVFQDLAVGARSVIPLETLQAHAMRTGQVASALLQDPEQKDSAYVAGLLHDLGKLVLVARVPERMAAAIARAQREGIPLHLVEARQWGVSHAELGAYMLGLWGLPYPIVEAVANHHMPGRVTTGEFGILAAVHVADALLYENPATEVDTQGVAPPRLDLDFLGRLGVVEELPRWRELALRLEDPAPSGATE